MATINSMEFIAYSILLLTAFAFSYQIIFGGLLDVQIQVNNAQKDQYEKAVVMENLLNLKYSESELNDAGIDIESRRALIPARAFSNRKGGSDDIGFRIRNSNCYIPRVNLLDGENFAFAHTYREADASNRCRTEDQSLAGAVSSPVLLKKQNGEIVSEEVFVYHVSSADSGQGRVDRP